MVDDFAIQRVSSIAVLRGIPVSTTRSIHLLSYYGDNVESGGDFYGALDAAPGTYVDNGGSIIVPTGGDGSAAWRANDLPDPRQWGAKGDGSTNDTTAVSNCLNNSKGRVIVPAGTYKLTALTITKSNLDIYLTDGAILQFPVLGADTAAITIDADNVSISGFGKIAGPNGGVYVQKEIGIKFAGTSISDRRRGLKVDCEIYGFGAYGIYTHFAELICTRPGLYVHDCQYCGVGLLSTDNVRIDNGVIDMLSAVGTGGNAYGISCSHISTGYDVDPNAGTPLAVNPFCSDVDIIGLTVIGPRIWQAIDTHACYGFKVVNCHTYAAKYGISFPTSSGDAANFSGYDNSALNNIIDSRLPDGTVDALGGPYPIALTIEGPGDDVHYNKRSRIIGNTIYGYGEAGTSTGVIRVNTGCRNLLIANNTIDHWNGAAILISNYSDNIAVGGNVFGGMALACDTDGGTDSVGALIAMSGADVGSHIIIDGNTHAVDGGFRAKRSILASGVTATSFTLLFGVNDFQACLNDTNLTAVQTHGPGAPGEISVTGVTGSITVDASSGRISPGTPLTIRFSGLTGAVTVTNITGLLKNQLVVLVNEDTTYAVTLDRTNAVLAGGANWVSDRYDTLMLHKGAANLYELSRSANS